MKGLRNIGLPRYVYAIIIVVQFVLIAVLLCLNHRTGLGSVVSSSVKDKGRKYMNRHVGQERNNLDSIASQHDDSNADTNNELDELYEERLHTADWVCDNSDEAVLDFVPSGEVFSYTARNTSIHYCSAPKFIIFTNGELDELYEERLHTADWVCDNSDEAVLDFVPSGEVFSYTARNTSIHYCSAPKVGELDELYEERLHTADWVCDNSDEAVLDFVPSGEVFSYTARNTSIHYCSAPKVGSTVWKKIFRFLYSDFPKDMEPSRPSDIDRWFVHYGNLTAEQMTNMKCFVALQPYFDGKLFMFARDPYARLWSAYIDKFVLPDFWQTFAMKAYKTLHNLKNVTIPEEERCFKNITFTEFLKYAISPQKSHNEHWVPLSKLCSPCHAKFDFIGKQETFFEDYKYILNKYKLGHLIEPEQDSFESRVKHETSMLIDYNFGIKKLFVNQTGCFVPRDIAKRLWRVFQYNGYIHEHIDFPYKALKESRLKTDPIAALSRLVKKTLKDQKRLGLNTEGQKRAQMVKAYRAVPRDILKDVQEFYLRDFDMFDYEKSPKDIF